MLHWTPDLVVSITSAAIALVAASVSALFSYRGFRIQKLGARDQYFSGLISWAENAVDLTAEAVHVCDLDLRKLPPGEFFKRRHQLQFRLSATIEKGRWFFPNIDVDTHGIHKEEGIADTGQWCWIVWCGHTVPSARSTMLINRKTRSVGMNS
jgi:hypothetical protein